MIGVDHDAFCVDVQDHQAEALATLVIRIELIPRCDPFGKVRAIELQDAFGITLPEGILGRDSDALGLPRRHPAQARFEHGSELAVAVKKRHGLGVGPLHELTLAVVQAIGKVDNGIGTYLKCARMHESGTCERKPARGQPPCSARDKGDGPSNTLARDLGLSLRELHLAKLASLLLFACNPSGPSVTTDGPGAVSAAQSSPLAPLPARVAIPTGEFQAGTRPGRFLRDPEREPSTFRARLGSFEIDRFPYPNQSDRPPRLGASIDEATRACSEISGRLCTELEWEYACSGLQSQPFATGTTFTQQCNNSLCSSEFGLIAMGTQPEWTATTFGAGSPSVGQPVLRGASSDPKTATDARRCAHRFASSAPLAKEVGFRCCYGAPNGERIIEPSDGVPFEKARLDGPALKKLLQLDPRTAPLAAELTLFAEPDGVNTVLGRGPGDRQGFDFTTSPLYWRPTLGARFLVFAGKSGKATSFVLAYHAIGADEFELASSFIMRGEQGPVVLAYSASLRPRLHFSSCWGCLGESGRILFRDPDGVVVVQP
jgi:hypothetical protein